MRLFTSLFFVLLLVTSAHAQPINVKPQQILAPSGNSLTVCSEVQPSVRIQNLSDFNVPPFGVVLSIKDDSGHTVYGPATVQTTQLSPAGTQTVSFPGVWQPTRPRLYFIQAITNATGDVNHNDDTLRTIVDINPGYMSKAAAIRTVRDSVIAKSPFAAKLVGYMRYLRSGSDSVLYPGWTVSDYDSSFYVAISAPSYLFFLDNDPSALWFHSSTFVVMNACSGRYQTFASNSLPEVNGQQLDERTFDNDDFVGQKCGRGTLLPSTPLAAAPNTSDWALIIGGPAFNPWDSTAFPNDIERIKGGLNGAATGPQVTGSNVVVVNGGGSSYAGATKMDICDSITAMAGKACKKVYIYILAHGWQGKDGFVVRSEDPHKKGELFRYDTLACKLLASGIQNVCVVNIACYGGSAIAAFRKTWPRPGGGPGLKLKGIVITSANGSNPAHGDSSGSRLIQPLVQCQRDPVADLNLDGHVSLAEAWTWAKAKNPGLTADGGDCVGIDPGSKIKIKPPGSEHVDDHSFSPGSASIDIFHVYYHDSTGHDSQRRFLYITNNSARPQNISSGRTGLQVFCLKRGRPATSIFGPERIDLGPGERRCLLEIPADCDGVTLDWPVLHLVAPDTLFSYALEQRTIKVQPGELVLESFDIPAESGKRYISSVVAIPSWLAEVEPKQFTVPDAIGAGAVQVSALIPDTARSGGMVDVKLVPTTTGDTLRFPLQVLIDRQISASGTQSYSYNYVEADTNVIDLASGTLSFDRSVLSLNAPSSKLSLSGDLRLTGSLITSPTAYSVTMKGPVDWQSSAIENADSILLESAKPVAIDLGAVINARSTALTLRGDQHNTNVRSLHVDSSAKVGLLFDHATNAKLNDVTIERIGGSHVKAVGQSHIRFVDSHFDASRISLTSNDTLERAWSTHFAFVDSSYNSFSGIVIQLTDANDKLVSMDTTDSLGMTRTFVLPEFTQIGANRTPLSAYRVAFRFNGKDSVFNYSATENRDNVVVLRGVASQVQMNPNVLRISLYPDPASDKITIDVGDNSGQLTLDLYDITGRRLRTANYVFHPYGASITYDVSQLAPGSYYLIIRSGNSATGTRFLKK